MSKMVRYVYAVNAKTYRTPQTIESIAHNWYTSAATVNSN